MPYFLPHVWLTLADTSVALSTTSRDLDCRLCSSQSGTMYQPLSVELSFWMWAPTVGFFVHAFSAQYDGTAWRLNVL